mgnify:CR=1 FL=1
MNNKRTEIIIETKRVVEVSGAYAVVERCPECAAVTKWATVEATALRTGIRARVLFHWIVAGLIHNRDSREGLVLICLPSLTARLAELNESEALVQR